MGGCRPAGCPWLSSEWVSPMRPTLAFSDPGPTPPPPTFVSSEHLRGLCPGADGPPRGPPGKWREGRPGYPRRARPRQLRPGRRLGSGWPWCRASSRLPPADRASGCRPQCFMERERPRAEEARVSGPPSSLHPLPWAPRGCSHSPSIPLQGDNNEGDPGCVGSPGLTGAPGLPGQRGEEVRAEPSPGLDPEVAGVSTSMTLSSRGQFPSCQKSSRALRWLPASLGSLSGAFEALGHRRPALLWPHLLSWHRASSQLWAPGHSSSPGLAASSACNSPPRPAPSPLQPFAHISPSR